MCVVLHLIPNCRHSTASRVRSPLTWRFSLDPRQYPARGGPLISTTPEFPLPFSSPLSLFPAKTESDSRIASFSEICPRERTCEPPLSFEQSSINNSHFLNMPAVQAPQQQQPMEAIPSDAIVSQQPVSAHTHSFVPSRQEKVSNADMRWAGSPRLRNPSRKCRCVEASSKSALAAASARSARAVNSPVASLHLVSHRWQKPALGFLRGGVRGGFPVNKCFSHPNW